jgi:hypothetical protein
VQRTHWTGLGPDFSVSWGGRPWTLELDDASPGLRFDSDRAAVKLLSLHGLAQAGRFESGVFTRANLVGFERVRSRVQATFAPRGWGGLVVRAAWTPIVRRDAIELEIQVSCTSVGEIHDLEVMVVSQVSDEGREQRPAVRMEARDARSAALTYDGRESAVALGDMTTVPLSKSPQLSFRPRVFARQDRQADAFYVEMAQLNDVARRITGDHVLDGASTPLAVFTRYGLFGHDLEKGVVLRSRLRGYWISSLTPEDDAQSLYQEFLREPLPLGR